MVLDIWPNGSSSSWKSSICERKTTLGFEPRKISVEYLLLVVLGGTFLCSAHGRRRRRLNSETWLVSLLLIICITLAIFDFISKLATQWFTSIYVKVIDFADYRTQLAFWTSESITNMFATWIGHDEIFGSSNNLSVAPVCKFVHCRVVLYRHQHTHALVHLPQTERSLFLVTEVTEGLAQLNSPNRGGDLPQRHQHWQNS